MKVTLTIALAVALVAFGFWIGRRSVESWGKHANDLIRVGFRMIDPEGFDVKHWDEYDRN